MVSFVKFIPVMVIALTLVMTLGVITRIKMAGTSFNTAMIFYKQLIQVFKLPFSLEKYRKPLMKQLQKEKDISPESRELIESLLNSKWKMFIFFLNNYKILIDVYEQKALKYEDKKIKKSKKQKYDFDTLFLFVESTTEKHSYS